MELTLFETPAQSLKSSKTYYKGLKGRFTSKTQSEVDNAKIEVKKWKQIAEFYKQRCERYEKRLQ